MIYGLLTRNWGSLVRMLTKKVGFRKFPSFGTQIGRFDYLPLWNWPLGKYLPSNTQLAYDVFLSQSLLTLWPPLFIAVSGTIWHKKCWTWFRPQKNEKSRLQPTALQPHPETRTCFLQENSQSKFVYVFQMLFPLGAFIKYERTEGLGKSKSKHKE